ncbi:MAG: hypothetical protein BRD26_07735 [Bacteroidetes bacterium QH_1_64_81]|nr:MAG: hypothetical protein BRD26_07735 [Bacteroidetes bacterium QH_1_64_81]
MDASVTPILRTSKQKDDGRAPVWIRITAHRKSHELASAYNDKIWSLRLECKEAALDADTAQAVKDEVQGNRGSLT